METSLDVLLTQTRSIDGPTKADRFVYLGYLGNDSFDPVFAKAG